VPWKKEERDTIANRAASALESGLAHLELPDGRSDVGDRLTGGMQSQGAITVVSGDRHAISSRIVLVD
jgi:hypothetical protein